MTQKVSTDFGQGKVDIEVPDTATVVEFTDPELLADPGAAVDQALAAPLGLPPLAEMARPGMSVAIGFDDITRPNTPPRLILPRIVKILEKSGVKERDIVFV